MNKNEISFEDLQIRISNFIDKADVASKDVIFMFNIDSEIDQKTTLSSIIGMNIYRIIQEAVNNAIKYAKANTITVNLSEEKNVLKIEIKDNGKGFDVNSVELGNGLNNMKKRAQEINARFEIDSKEGAGTIITISK
jgi:signal transduction histidine kinase